MCSRYAVASLILSRGMACAPVEERACLFVAGHFILLGRAVAAAWLTQLLKGASRPPLLLSPRSVDLSSNPA